MFYDARRNARLVLRTAHTDGAAQAITFDRRGRPGEFVMRQYKDPTPAAMNRALRPLAKAGKKREFLATAIEQFGVSDRCAREFVAPCAAECSVSRCADRHH